MSLTKSAQSPHKPRTSVNVLFLSAISRTAAIKLVDTIRGVFFSGAVIGVSPDRLCGGRQPQEITR